MAKHTAFNHTLLGVIFLALVLVPVSVAAQINVDSQPSAADVTVLYGTDAGKSLGKTPFNYDPTLNGGVTWMKFVKSGYSDATGVVYSYMQGKTVIVLNPNCNDGIKVAEEACDPSATPTGCTAPQTCSSDCKSCSGALPQDNPPSVSASHSPESPQTSDTVVITASATDDKGLTEISIYADGSNAMSCTVSGTSASCPYAETFAAGTHTYYATAKDSAGKSTTSSTTQFSVTQSQCVPSWKCESPLNGYEYDGCNNRRTNSACNPSTSTNTLTLKPGWNQISSSIASGIDISTIEQSCTILPYKTYKLWGWNAQTQTWIYPTKVEALKGYWIYAAYQCTVPLSGTPATFSSLQLYNGWNKISASGTFSAIQGTCAGRINGNWAWNWDKATEKWIHPATMQLDKGYWIKVDQNCVLGG